MKNRDWRLDLYRFGGNKPALLIGVMALLLGLFTVFAGFTLEDAPVCRPNFAGQGQPNATGKVITGRITEREERLDGCKSIAIQVEGHSAQKFAPDQQAFDATRNNPEASTVLVLRDLPGRYTGLPVGTNLMALYDEQKEAPFALFFPGAPNTGLDLGGDNRADYSKTRLMLYLAAGVLLFIGISVLVIAWRYPVRWNPPPRSQVAAMPRPPKKPRRPRADPITGEPLPGYEPERRGIFGKAEPLPPGADDDYS